MMRQKPIFSMEVLILGRKILFEVYQNDNIHKIAKRMCIQANTQLSYSYHIQNLIQSSLHRFHQSLTDNKLKSKIDSILNKKDYFGQSVLGQGDLLKQKEIFFIENNQIFNKCKGNSSYDQEKERVMNKQKHYKRISQCQLLSEREQNKGKLNFRKNSENLKKEIIPNKEFNLQRKKETMKLFQNLDNCQNKELKKAILQILKEDNVRNLCMRNEKKKDILNLQKRGKQNRKMQKQKKKNIELETYFKQNKNSIPKYKFNQKNKKDLHIKKNNYIDCSTLKQKDKHQNNSYLFDNNYNELINTSFNNNQFLVTGQFSKQLHSFNIQSQQQQKKKLSPVNHENKMKKNNPINFDQRELEQQIKNQEIVTGINFKNKYNMNKNNYDNSNYYVNRFRYNNQSMINNDYLSNYQPNKKYNYIRMIRALSLPVENLQNRLRKYNCK